MQTSIFNFNANHMICFVIIEDFAETITDSLGYIGCSISFNYSHYFNPVVAIPVVIKRCRKAKTNVIGSSVSTVIAST